MIEVIHQLNVWAEAWCGLMWAILWQSTLLVVLIALGAVLLRRSSPTVRYWLWQIVAIKLLLMPFWTLAVPMPFWADNIQPQGFEVAALPGSAPPVPDGLTRPESIESLDSSSAGQSEGDSVFAGLGRLTWQSWLLLGWGAAVALQVSRLVRQRIQLGRLLREAVPADENLAALVGDLADRLGIKRVPSVVLTNADCSLFLCGLGRPVLVAPASLLPSLGRMQHRQVLLHELAHVKRLDLLWGWPAEIARIVYFFHPVVYWAGQKLGLERELACDQLAMSLTSRDPADYAQTLVQVVSHSSQPAAIRPQAAISAGLDGGRAEPQLQRTARRTP